jgi:hypothetical protein
MAAAAAAERVLEEERWEAQKSERLEALLHAQAMRRQEQKREQEQRRLEKERARQAEARRQEEMAAAAAREDDHRLEEVARESAELLLAHHPLEAAMVAHATPVSAVVVEAASFDVEVERTGVAELPEVNEEQQVRSSPLYHFLAENKLLKYLDIFDANEVDMGALVYCTDDDLKEIGILKGPRVKIRMALTNAAGRK